MLLALWAGSSCSHEVTAQQSFEKGIELGARGKLPEAQRAFEETLKIDPFFRNAKTSLEIIADVKSEEIKDQTAVHIFKAFAYLNKSLFKDSIAEANQALQNASGYGAAYRLRGMAYGSNHQSDLALADFNQALKEVLTLDRFML